MADVIIPDEYLDSDADRSWEVILAVALSLAVSTVMVGLRIYTRKFMTKEMNKDDWAAIITLLLTYGVGITIAYSTKFGLGKHFNSLNYLDDLFQYLELFFISGILHTAGLLAAKITLLLQYYRVLAIQRMRIVYIIAILVIAGWGISQIFVKIFMCQPVQASWDPTMPAVCLHAGIQGYVNAIGDILTGLAIFVLPMPVLKHLNLPSTERVLLVGVFIIGLFTVAISAIRMKFNQPLDMTWENVEWSGWAVGELAGILTCACLPTLRPFLARFFPSLKGSSARATIGYNHKVGDTGGSGRSWWRFRSRGAVSEKGGETRTEIRELRHELGNEGAKYEVLGDAARYEAPGDGQRHEAPGDGPRHEMLGDIPDVVRLPPGVHQANVGRG